MIVTDSSIEIASEVVKVAIQDAIRKNGAEAFRGSHECSGVITEEYSELVDAVQGNKGIIVELIDIAVAAIWSIASAISIKGPDCISKP